MKKICISGPIIERENYYIPLVERLNINTLDSFIDNGFYYIVHAPRQSGKSTSMREYARRLNKERNYTALYFTFELGHKKSVDQAFRGICREWLAQLRFELPQEKRS